MTKKEIIANINTFIEEEIVKLIAEIEEKNEHWKRCQDGSYEMACSEAGLYVLSTQLRALKQQ